MIALDCLLFRIDLDQIFDTNIRNVDSVNGIMFSIWKEMSLSESMSEKDRARLAIWDYPLSDKFTNMWR